METSQEENGKPLPTESNLSTICKDSSSMEKTKDTSAQNSAPQATETPNSSAAITEVIKNTSVVSTKVNESQKIVVAEAKTEARNKRLDRSRKKNEKNHEIFLKSIQALSAQDQIDTLVKKMNDMMEENLTLNNSSKFYKNQSMILEKEKEQLRTEHNKTLMARTRLESVCRELQNNYKQIKEETAQKIREEEEKRKEVTTKFQTTLADVSKMMEQNSGENIKLRNDNIQISDRFKKLCEEFKAREEDVQRISKQLGLEKKLSEANLQRCQLELEAERCEKEVLLKEKEALLRKLHDTTRDSLHMEISMKNMEEDLAKYNDKYQKFESTITKSNEIFEIYKVELASMSKQVTKLETDCITWKERWVQTSQAVNRLIGVNQSLENDLMLSDKKLDQLASLCRFLQNERNCYLKQLKENNIKPEVSTLPDEKASPETPESKIITVSNKEVKTPPMTAKERELQALRSEIVKLQTEINKAVEKEMEEKLKAKQQEVEKNKRRAKNKKAKKNSKNDGKQALENAKKSSNEQNSGQSSSVIEGPEIQIEPETPKESTESNTVQETDSNIEPVIVQTNTELKQDVTSDVPKTNSCVDPLEKLLENGNKPNNIISQPTGASNLALNKENGASNSVINQPLNEDKTPN